MSQTINLTYTGLNKAQQQSLKDKDIDAYLIYATLSKEAHDELVANYIDHADRGPGADGTSHFVVSSDIYRKIVVKYQLLSESIYSDSQRNNKYLGTAAIPKALRTL
jgi:hypothetical protein